MTAAGAPFSIEAVGRALGAAVAAVEIVEELDASAAQVARLRITPAAGGASFTAIGKSAEGAGLGAARRELCFFERLAPRWDHPAPRLLGAGDTGSDTGRDGRLLILTEDLAATGYALLRGAPSDAELRAIADTLVTLHARFWEAVPTEILDGAPLGASVTRAAQAWPAAAIRAHAADVREAVACFRAVQAAALDAEEQALLEALLDRWEPSFLARVADGRALTLIHGDFHLLGNVFFAAHAPRPRVIDWSEWKPGLGPHDLAYCLVSAPTADRGGRDAALLRRYWEGLRASGVSSYDWDLCQWDYRFALLTNIFQAIFQQSLTWFRKTAALCAELDCRAALHQGPPLLHT